MTAIAIRRFFVRLWHWLLQGWLLGRCPSLAGYVSGRAATEEAPLVPL